MLFIDTVLILFQKAMLAKVQKQVGKLLNLSSAYSYNAPQYRSDVHHHPGLTAKRIIKCVSDRLNKVDPERWNGVPITFSTHWSNEGGYIDVGTCIHVHDALEREFGVDIKDRHTLISSVEHAYYIISLHHEAL